MTDIEQAFITVTHLVEDFRAKEKHSITRKCQRLDKEIDQLVYELYGLTEDEIKIVEGR